MPLHLILASIDGWDEHDCLNYLEEDGTPAPEYDLENGGLVLLREDCRERARGLDRAA